MSKCCCFLHHRFIDLPARKGLKRCTTSSCIKLRFARLLSISYPRSIAALPGYGSAKALLRPASPNKIQVLPLSGWSPQFALTFYRRLPPPPTATFFYHATAAFPPVKVPVVNHLLKRNPWGNDAWVPAIYWHPLFCRSTWPLCCLPGKNMSPGLHLRVCPAIITIDFLRVQCPFLHKEFNTAGALSRYGETFSPFEM